MKRTFRLTLSSWLFFSPLLFMLIDGVGDLKYSFSLLASWVAYLIFLVLTWYNLKIDWTFFKSQTISLGMPPSSWVHVVSILFVPLALYCCANLRLYFDSHLSFYSVYVLLPTQIVGKLNDHLGVAHTGFGVYLMSSCIVLVSVGVGAYNCLRFTNSLTVSEVVRDIPKRLVYARFLLAMALFPLVANLGARVFNSCVWLFDESEKDPYMLALTNTGPLFFDAIAVFVFAVYAVWLLTSANTILKLKRGANAGSTGE